MSLYPLVARCADLPSRRPLTGVGLGSQRPAKCCARALLCALCFKGCSPQAGPGMVSSHPLALCSLCLWPLEELTMRFIQRT